MNNKNIMFIFLATCISIVHGTPFWWDNPNNFESWTQYNTTGSIQNEASQGQIVIVQIDIPNLGINRNTQNIWIQVEWEVTRGAGYLLTTSQDHLVKWTYDECPIYPYESLTNLEGADFMVYEGSFTPTHEVDIGNTFDNGNEFSLRIDEQPECERLGVVFNAGENSEIHYRIEVQTVCWGVVEVAGDCPTPSPGLYPGATDVVLLEFTMDTGPGGDVIWDKIQLGTPFGLDNSVISSVTIQSSDGITIAGPTTWNPTELFISAGSIFYGQTFDVSSDELINENQKIFKVFVDVPESAPIGTSVDIQIPDSARFTATSPGVVLNDNFPVRCRTDIRTLSTNLENFAAECCADGINLVWQADKKNNAAGFNIYRQEAVGDSYTKINTALISVSPLPLPSQHYTYTDEHVKEAETYSYMLEEISTRGQSVKSRPQSVTYYSSTAVENRFKSDGFVLVQNYPNPFNPSTNIVYQVKEDSHVSVGIFDLTGKQVADLVNSQHFAGQYQITWDASEMPSGVYFVALKAEAEKVTKRILLMK